MNLKNRVPQILSAALQFLDNDGEYLSDEVLAYVN